MAGQFDDHGIRFRYPADWELEDESNDERTNLTLTAPDGVAFAIVSLDATRPDPKAEADQALAAMREEYPTLEDRARTETIDGHEAIGYDAEFFSLDFVNTFSVRSFRTPRRTVVVFTQWSDAEGDEIGDRIDDIRRSIEETDAFDLPGTFDGEDDEDVE